MIASKIKYIIEKKGYEMNKWQDFADFSAIYLNQTASLYTNKTDRRIMFDTSTNTVKTVYGYIDSNGDFKDFRNNSSDSSTWSPNDMIGFDLVNGFICSSIRIPGGLYTTKMFKKK